jgi:hypothetical protein
MGKNAQSSPRVRTELPEILGQAKAELLNIVAVEQSWLDARESAMVRPGLTKNGMHAAIVNRLDDNFDITEPLLAAIVPNQQSCSLMGNGQLLKQFAIDLPKAYDLRRNLRW